MARFKVALEQEAPKSDREDQMSSNEACEARSKVPLELGAKMSKVLERPKMDHSANQQRVTRMPNPRTEEIGFK